MVRKKLGLAVLLGAYIFVTLLPHKVIASDLNVQARVLYPTPSSASTVTEPANFSVFTASQVTIKGVCQQATPAFIVSAWRGEQQLGSAVCLAGAYEIPITLAPGLQALVIKTANIQGIYGPESSVHSLTYTEPVVVQPLPPSKLVPTTPAEEEGSANIGSDTGLYIASDKSFSVITSQANTATVRLVVGGGSAPYTLTLNWGDGSTEQRMLQQAGTYEFSHTYKDKRNYVVHALMRDVQGAFTRYFYAVVFGDTNPKSSADEVTVSQRTFPWRFVAVSIAIILFMVILIWSYYLGYRRATKDQRHIAAKNHKPRKKARVQ